CEGESALNGITTRNVMPLPKFHERGCARGGIEFFHRLPPVIRHILSPMDWSQIASPELDDFEAMARAAFVSLPDEFRTLAGNIALVVQDFPDEDVIRDLELESEFEILGLFQGPDLASTESGLAHAGQT